MRLPRIILNPSVAGWIRLLQRERRETARLRRELLEWQNKVLQQARMQPLFTPPPKPVEQPERPPIGATAKKLHLAQKQNINDVPTAEQILEAAERAARG